MNERAPKKIVIDAGHGGNDPGTSGNGIVEKEYNLLISDYIYDRLKALGLDVSMTRTTDETLTPSQRVNKAKSFYGSGNDVLLISNHINAGGGDSHCVTNV
ncbi:MAG: N-acetylmuramoyl-L-alanine amidase [Bacilli bacterium]|nr:N-acetylmuramoyl-L-alanine amidase [Bacilli bacterium]